MLQIEDDIAALDFDLTCSARLWLWDIENQKRQYEALMEAQTGKQATTSPLNRKHVGTITPANFRDQNW